MADTELSEDPLPKSTTAPRFRESRRKPNTAIPRVVRISVIDADATDSSSDEEASLSNFSSEQRRVKRFISYVTIEPQFTKITTTFTTTSPTTSCQARDSHSDDSVLARRVPLKRKRRQRNARGRTASSSDTMVSLTGGEVKNRRVRNWPATNVTSEVEAVVVNSGIANSAFPHTELEQAYGRQQAHEADLKSDKGPIEEKLPGSSSDGCSSESFDSLFSSDFFAYDMIFPPELDFDLFADLGSGLDQDLVCDVGSFVFDPCSLSTYHFGFGISDTTWPTDEPSLDIVEIFGSDPLVAI